MRLSGIGGALGILRRSRDCAFALQHHFGYYRVSTEKEDANCVAQRLAVENYLNGGGWKLIGESPRLRQARTTIARS
jgi:hypothetical protein